MLRSLRRVRFGRRGTGLARAYFVGSGGKRRLIVSALINILKTLVGLSQHRLLAAEAFPSADRHVAIVWIDFDHASPPARPLCRDERRTRAANGSRIRSPRLVTSRMASAIIATGLTV